MNLLDFIFPKRCLTCWRFGKYFCDRCTAEVRTIEERERICPMCERPAFGGMTHPRCKTTYSLDGLTSIFGYDGIIREAIKTLKYRFVTDLAQEFASLVPPDVFSKPYTLTPKPFLVPIPLHPSRFRQRGFNQAEVLGKLLADRLNILIRTDILRRVRKTTPQVETKDRKERLKNMKGVFVLSHETCNVTRDTVILFDDVFTTGATMRAACETLKRAGVKFVWAVTIAR